MTAATGNLQSVPRSRFTAGFGNVFAREFRTWWATRRWWTQALLWTGLLNGLLLAFLWIADQAPASPDGQQLTVGQTVGAYGDGPVKQYEISGIVRFGSVDSLAGASISVFDLPTAQRLFDKHGKLDLIRVGAKPGVCRARRGARDSEARHARQASPARGQARRSLPRPRSAGPNP